MELKLEMLLKLFKADVAADARLRSRQSECLKTVVEVISSAVVMCNNCVKNNLVVSQFPCVKLFPSHVTCCVYNFCVCSYYHFIRNVAVDVGTTNVQMCHLDEVHADN